MAFRLPRFVGRSVLVIEDDAESRAMMRQMLEALGVHVVTAEDAYQALGQLADQAVDLILCDLRMPSMDGFLLIDRLRADPRWSHTPIIAVTALASEADYQRTWEAGFDGHVVKPVDFDAVADVLARYLPASVEEPSEPRPGSRSTRPRATRRSPRPDAA